jgi:Zn-dependent protease
MLQDGYWTLGRFRGVPLRMHVLTPLGALLFSGFRVEPGAWIGFLLLVLLHEIGHAIVVARYGLRVSGIDLQVYGGVCRWSGPATDWQRSVIAWGGVLAQAALLVLTVLLLGVTGAPRTEFGRELASVFVGTNLWLIALNLAPFPPLDGAEAWKIVGELRRRRPWQRISFRRDDHPPPAPPRDDSPLPPDEARRIAKAFEDAVRRRS